MPISVQELLADVPQAIALAEAVKAAIDALPPAASRKPSDFLNLASVVLKAAGPLADSLSEQAKS